MTLMQSMERLFGGVGRTGNRAQGVYAPAQPLLEDPLSAITTYRVMRSLYDNNGLYEDLQFILRTRGLWKEALQPIRNPANRVVEFYAAKTCPGADLDQALPIQTDKVYVKKAIQQVWTWSNWAAKKQVAARWHAIYGDLFIKVVGRMDPGRVFYQLLTPETTTEIEQDERGYLTHIRMDIPVVRLDARGMQVAKMVTEVWDKQADSLRMWEHEKGPGVDLSELGRPKENVSISERYRVNFIPIVQGKFRDTGEVRGRGSFEHAFDKINEANRQATRLHQLLFRHNNVFWALTAGGSDPTGRPIPAVQIMDKDGKVQLPEVDMSDDRFISLPGNSELQSLVPDLPYGPALDILNAQMHELEKDLPEMAYYDLRDFGTQLSGRAARILLSGAIDRAIEARGNFEDALIRADKMALTIGQATGALPGLVGSFEEGTWDHTFAKRDVIPTNDLEDSQADLAAGQAATTWHQLGVSKRQLLIEKGYQPADIDRMEEELKAEQEADMGTALLDQFNRGNVNGNQNGDPSANRNGSNAA